MNGVLAYILIKWICSYRSSNIRCVRLGMRSYLPVLQRCVKICYICNRFRKLPSFVIPLGHCITIVSKKTETTLNRYSGIDFHSFSRGDRLESRPWHWLSFLIKFVMVFFSLYRHAGIVPRLGHDIFLPNPLNSSYVVLPFDTIICGVMAEVDM
jgi:hypothetical protein